MWLNKLPQNKSNERSMSMENVKSNLKRHIDKLHKDIRNHVCKKCGYTASIRKGSLEKVHEKKMSRVQSFSCPQ